MLHIIQTSFRCHLIRPAALSFCILLRIVHGTRSYGPQDAADPVMAFESSASIPGRALSLPGDLSNSARTTTTH